MVFELDPSSAGDGGGTVRLSWGAFTSHEQVEAVIRAIQEIARA